MKILQPATHWTARMTLRSLLLAVCGTVLLAKANAAEAPTELEQKPARTIRFADDVPAVQAQPPAAPADQVDAFLARKVVIDVEGMPLGEFARALSKLGGIPVNLDREALNDIGNDGKSPISLSVAGMTAHAVLRHTLRQVDPLLRLNKSTKRGKRCQAAIVWG